MTVQKTAQTEMGSRFELFGAFLKIGSDPRLTWIVEDLLLEQYCGHLDTHEEIEIEFEYESFKGAAYSDLIPFHLSQEPETFGNMLTQGGQVFYDSRQHEYCPPKMLRTKRKSS